MFKLTKTLSKYVKPSNQSIRRNFATYKTTTGLVGLEVDVNGRENLLIAANKVLESVKKIPECGYRTDVEKWFNFIVKTATELEDIKAIEDEIDLGQIEEVIDACHDELALVDYYYEEKGWERVEKAKATADAMIKEMEDAIFFTEKFNIKKEA